jgi:hypothetical protein
VLDTENNIVLIFEEGNITRHGAQFIIQNQGGFEYLHRSGHCFLQIHRNGQWYEIDQRRPFTHVARRDGQYGLSPRESQVHTFNWSHESLAMYGELPDGKYRIVVEFFDIRNGNHPNTRRTTYAIHEFEITSEHPRR